MPNYHIEDTRGADERCYECGAPATIRLVADTSQPDTGYLDEVALCEDCAEKRQV